MEGKQFGRYRLIALVGRGGMGEVWRAEDALHDNRLVALKLLPPHMSDDESYKQRFRHEARIAAHLSDPHVVPIHSYGEIDGRLYVDMRLIEGRDLAAVLRDGPLEPSRAVRIIEQVALALHAAHKAGLVHRDVKPSNILLDDNDFAYLIDFGIARAPDQTTLTGGRMIGTWQYMAPERLRAGEIDARADVYALACVLYECLTGERPYPGDRLEYQLAAHLTEPPPRPSVHAGIPPEFDPVIAKGMAKDPHERYATTVEFARAASDVVTAPISVPPRPAPPPLSRAESSSAPTVSTSAVTVPGPPRPAPVIGARPKRRPWWRSTRIALAGAALAVVAALVTVVAVMRPWNKHDEPSPVTADRVTVPLYMTRPSGVAVDAAGTLYVVGDAQGGEPGLVKLTAGATVPSDAVFAEHFVDARGVAVNRSGEIYVTDVGVNTVLLFKPGSMVPTPVLSGLNQPAGAAVDASGAVYVADSGNARVIKWTTVMTTLPFGLQRPTGVAVDNAGNVYVADNAARTVLKLAAGSERATTLPFGRLDAPYGVAVDARGDVFVTDSGSNRVLELAVDAAAPTALPFDNLASPQGIAVDAAGAVYVADTGNNSVLKLVPAT